jgi:hypothetical protein
VAASRAVAGKEHLRLAIKGFSSRCIRWVPRPMVTMRRRGEAVNALKSHLGWIVRMLTCPRIVNVLKRSARRL